MVGQTTGGRPDINVGNLNNLVVEVQGVTFQFSESSMNQQWSGFQMRSALRDVVLTARAPERTKSIRFADRVIVRGRGAECPSGIILVGLISKRPRFAPSSPKCRRRPAEHHRRRLLSFVRASAKGVVVNIESTVESIKKAVEEAELMAAVQINLVYTGIAGSHISGETRGGLEPGSDP